MKKCWICNRTSKEVWEAGGSTSVNWSKDEKSCIDDWDTGFDKDTIPVCCVCNILMQKVIDNRIECDKEYPSDSDYVLMDYLKSFIESIKDNL